MIFRRMNIGRGREGNGMLMMEMDGFGLYGYG